MLQDSASVLRSIVESEPGLDVTELQRRLGLGWGAFYHQLRKLEREGQLRLVRVQHRRIVVSTRVSNAEDVLVARAHLRPSKARQIAGVLVAQGPLSIEEAAARTGLHLRTVRYHVQKLVRAGLAQGVRGRRPEAYHATPLLARALS